MFIPLMIILSTCPGGMGRSLLSQSSYNDNDAGQSVLVSKGKEGLFLVSIFKGHMLIKSKSVVVTWCRKKVKGEKSENG